ncbi:MULTISPECIES: hypothetical protein [Burkholderia cepacia complex]|uniref:hypothetical protein n=1 Tax=Burkholderia cepacia complex TaxID=87882 RepID=UPI0012D8D0E1|nr:MULTISPECIES: hypothetical protein [Burkholderia cepacia complex]QTO47447.1 hypothetical protein J8I86_10450 [Burkholderia latens]
MTENLILARVVFDPQRDLLVGTVLATGATFETCDPREMAELLFAAGVRHGYVSMPDWREGDIAPCVSEKIALNHRLNQLGRGIEK